MGKLVKDLFVAFVAIFIMFFVLHHQPQEPLQPIQIKASKNISVLEKQFLANCKNEKCVMDAAKRLTDITDPTTAVNALAIFESVHHDNYVGDPHLWAHEVGAEAAKRYGITGKVFLQCPETFNYGCSHGFMEVAVQRSTSIKAAIEGICGPVEHSDKYSLKRKYYCYHGAGHGVIGTLKYDLTKSLETCDELQGYVATQGCWQGVFMEGNIAADEGTAPAGVFADLEHPLAPCDKVAEKYQNQCFINLPGRIIEMEKQDVTASVNVCLLTTDENRKTCLQGLGIVIASDRWQALHSKYNEGSLEATSWKNCQLFPVENLDSCIYGAVSEILNIDQYNVTRSINFCNLVDDNQKEWCFQTLGSLLRSQTSSTSLVTQECSMVPVVYLSNCVKGARL